jgi:hypothetical protein
MDAGVSQFAIGIAYELMGHCVPRYRCKISLNSFGVEFVASGKGDQQQEPPVQDTNAAQREATLKRGG